MAKETYKRKHLIAGLLTVSEDLSMTWCGAWQLLGGHGARAVTEGFPPDLQAVGREMEIGLAWTFETSKSTLRDTLSLTRPCPLILPTQFY